MSISKLRKQSAAHFADLVKRGHFDDHEYDAFWLKLEKQISKNPEYWLAQVDKLLAYKTEADDWFAVHILDHTHLFMCEKGKHTKHRVSGGLTLWRKLITHPSKQVSKSARYCLTNLIRDLEDIAKRSAEVQDFRHSLIAILSTIK